VKGEAWPSFNFVPHIAPLFRDQAVRLLSGKMILILQRMDLPIDVTRIGGKNVPGDNKLVARIF
jgi:hypothetical protein